MTTDASDHDRVWLLFDCDSVVSAHSSAAAADRACALHKARVKTDVGPQLEPFYDEHIEVFPIDVQG